MACAEDKYMLVIGRMVVGTAIGASATDVATELE